MPKISTPLRVGHLSRAAQHRDQNSKFHFLEVLSPTDRMYMPSFTNVSPVVSEPSDFENVDSAGTDGQTDGCTDGLLAILQVM